MANTPTDGPDNLTGTDGPDSLFGSLGNDIISPRKAGGGRDVVDGGYHDDWLYVDAGTETTSVNLEAISRIRGNVTSASGRYDISYNNIESIQFTGGSGNDFINAFTKLGGRIDGGAGIDHLVLKFSLASHKPENIGFHLHYQLQNTWYLDGYFQDWSIRNVDRITMTTFTGNDQITGGAYADTINTSYGNDTIDARSCPFNGDPDRVDGGPGVDLMYVSAAAEVKNITASFATGVDSQGEFRVVAKNIEQLHFTGGRGNDKADGGSLNDTLIGNAGHDTFFGGAGTDSLSGGAGNDTLNGGIGSDQLYAHEGNDTYIVDSQQDYITEFLNSGTDLVKSTAPTFQLNGNIENLYLLGAGNIEGYGNNLNNRITGNAGRNKLEGFAGNDVLDGGGGVDTMNGHDGNDTYRVNHALDEVVDGSAQGTDTVFTSATYKLPVSAGVEILRTSNNAGTGPINLTGNAVGQTIIGNAGANVINGGGGLDKLTGGVGKDTFVFDYIYLGGSNLVTITDFRPSDDAIRLENSRFTGLPAGTLAPGAFNTGAAATQADDRIIYNKATGTLTWDTDGSAGSNFAIQFAKLSPNLALTNADFVVV